MDERNYNGYINSMEKIAVIDDDLSATDNLKKLLKRYELEANQSFEVFAFQNAEDFLKNFQKQYALVFLDIQLPGMSGMDCAKEIRKQDKNVKIIFETCYGQFAIEGYKYDAIDYFVKPVSYYSLKMRMDSIDFSEEKKTTDTSLSIKLVDGMTKTLLVSEIFYIERSGRHIIFHTKGEEFESSARESLTSIEKTLSQHSFVRCNSGFVINLAKCEGIYHEYVLINGVKLPISRKLKKAFMDSVARYFKSL